MITALTRTFLVVLALLVAATTATANTNVTSCASITGYGDSAYTITADITSACIITGLNYGAGYGWVTVDCGGHSITGTQTTSGIPGVGSATVVLGIYSNANAVWLANCYIGDGTTSTSNGSIYWDCGNAPTSGLSPGIFSSNHVTLAISRAMVVQHCDGMTIQGGLTSGVYSQVFTHTPLGVLSTAINTGIRVNKFDDTYVDTVNLIWPGAAITLASYGASVYDNLLLGSRYVDDGMVLYGGSAAHPNLIHNNDIRDFGDAAIEGVGNTTTPVVGQSIYSNSIRIPYYSENGTLITYYGIGCFNAGDGSGYGCTMSDWYVDSNTIYGQSGAKVQGFRLLGGGVGTMANVTISNNTVTAPSGVFESNQIGSAYASRFWTASNVHIGSNHFGGAVDVNTPYGIYDDGSNYCTSSTAASLTCH